MKNTLNLAGFFSLITVMPLCADELPKWNGVSDDQWRIIKKIDQSNDCYDRIKAVEEIDLESAFRLRVDDVLADPFIIGKSLRKHRIVVLEQGVYPLEGAGLKVPSGAVLIGDGDVILDMTKVKKTGKSTHASLTVTNAAVKGLTVVNAPDAGIRMKFGATAYQMISQDSGRFSSVSTEGAGFYLKGREAVNLCVVSAVSTGSYNKIGTNGKTKNGGNADGFKVSFGASNVNLIDVHAYKNSDDGFDFWNAGTGHLKGNEDYAVRVFYSSAVKNGFDNGDGEGFKLGASNGKDEGIRFIYGSAACKNNASGFTSNKTQSKIEVKNLNASGNKKNYRKVPNFNKSSWKDAEVVKCK